MELSSLFAIELDRWIYVHFPSGPSAGGRHGGTMDRESSLCSVEINLGQQP